MTTFILTVKGQEEREEAERVTGLLRAEERMHSRGHQLGKIVGYMADILKSECRQFEEISLFNAPSECGGLVHRSAEKVRDEVLASAGLSRAEYNGLLSLRGDVKQAYFSGWYVDEPEEKML